MNPIVITSLFGEGDIRVCSRLIGEAARARWELRHFYGDVAVGDQCGTTLTVDPSRFLSSTPRYCTAVHGESDWFSLVTHVKRGLKPHVMRGVILDVVYMQPRRCFSTKLSHRNFQSLRRP